MESGTLAAQRALSRLRSGLGTTGEILLIALRTAPLPRLPSSVAEVQASWPVTVRAGPQTGRATGKPELSWSQSTAAVTMVRRNYHPHR